MGRNMIVVPPPETAVVTVAAMRIVRAVHYDSATSILADFSRRTMTITLVNRTITGDDLDEMVYLGHTRPGMKLATAYVRPLAEGLKVDVEFASENVIDHEIMAFAIRQLFPREMNSDPRRAYKAIYAQLRSTG